MPQCPNCFLKGRVIKKIDAEFSVYFCRRCHNGFTSPCPRLISKYYSHHYWTSPGLVGKIKDLIFNTSQRRRVAWVKRSILRGTILDVGSGEAKFGKTFPLRYNLVNLEPPSSKVKNRSVIKTDFLTWKTKQKFDVICFWESLEHTRHPQKYLEKAYQLLNRPGRIFIEFPRYNCLEARLFAKNWFHLDLPRHLVHLTDKGLVRLLKKSGFDNIKVKSVFSFEYALWDLAASWLNSFNIDITDHIKKSGDLPLFILLIPLILLSLILEFILSFLNQSPIALAVAEKND